MIGYVYLTSNTVNDILYIGKRQKPHFEKGYKGSGTHLKLAFKKYGKDKFSSIVLEECDTVEQLNKAEKKWIKQYRDDGIELYNIADGGDGGNCIKWDEFPPEKMAIAKEKNRIAHLGDKNAFFGKHHTEEYKKKSSEMRKGKKHSSERNEKIKHTKRQHLSPIVQIDKQTGDVIRKWNNWSEAGELFAQEHGRCCYVHVADCCNGKRESAYGYIWKYS